MHDPESHMHNAASQKIDGDKFECLAYTHNQKRMEINLLAKVESVCLLAILMKERLVSIWLPRSYLSTRF